MVERDIDQVEQPVNINHADTIRIDARQYGIAIDYVDNSDGLADAVPSAIAQATGLLGKWRQAVHVYVDELSEQIDRMRELSVSDTIALPIPGGNLWPYYKEENAVA